MTDARSSAALSGAASGASAGMALGPWGALVGGVVGGAAGYFGAPDDPNAPPPGQMPYPNTPGSVNTPYGGGYYDPYTGSFTQTQNNFDPYQFGQQADVNSMYDQFMGTNRGSSDVDYQIQQLQQQMQRLQGQNTGGPGVGQQQSLAEALGPNVAKMVTDASGKLIDFSDRNALIQNPALVAAFNDATKDSHGTFGKSGDGFMNWFKAWRDNAGIDQKVQKFQNDSKTNTGNTDTRNQAIQDLQNKIDYLGQAKQKVSGNSLANNPLLPFTKDIGGTWKGGDNTNPNQQAWGDLLAKKMGWANSDPNAELNKTLGGLGTAQGHADAMAGYEKDLAGLQDQKTNLQAGKLSELGGGALGQTLNFASDADFNNQSQYRDAQNARRGILGGSVGELSHAQDTLNLGNQHNQNALQAANYVNGVRQNQFGMDASAFGANNAAIAGNNATKMGGLNFKFNANNTGFNQGLQRQDLANSMQNNWYNQALSSLQQANQMRDTTRNQNVQDYQFGQNDNQKLYGRNMDMFNLLNQQKQQTFNNGLAQNQAQWQGMGITMPYTAAIANQNTQRDLGQYQMNQAYTMGNAQNQAAQNNANQSAWGNALGGLASGIGSYYGGQTSYNRMNNPANNPSAMTYNPNIANNPPAENSGQGQIDWHW